MTRLTTNFQPRIVAPSPLPSPGPAYRLLVLVPDMEADLAAVTHRVWELADATKANIKFLSLCNEAVQEPSLRRKLVTMSAMVNYGSVCAETEVIVGRNWVEAVKSCCQPDDMVVCFEEQRAGLFQKPLSQLLQSDVDVPIYILSGLYSPGNSLSNGRTRAALWAGFVAIFLGFFILQINIYHLATNWTTALELLSTAAEFWLIWVWNSLFS